MIQEVADSSLGKIGITVLQFVFGEHKNAAGKWEMESGKQPGCACSDDDNVILCLHSNASIIWPAQACVSAEHKLSGVLLL